ncbi:MAG: hypothetical protein ACI84D_000979 [Thalassolituus oleivorans]|jgi:hypothetical protein
MAPMARDDIGDTNPGAGVTATRPTTIAVAAPTAVTFPVRTISNPVQVTRAAAGASMVFTKAYAASPSAASAEPALKPNQPNQRSPDPKRTKGT